MISRHVMANIPDENKLNHKVNVFAGIYESESKFLMQNYFQKKRKEKKAF